MRKVLVYRDYIKNLLMYYRIVLLLLDKLDKVLILKEIILNF